jgi:GDP/UDP-N,N'-diacetylbacillosamine 2-epimerase (hydrolysing)
VRQLLIVTGTRADFGLWLPVLRAVTEHPDLHPRLLVTAMHLAEGFGETAREVRSAGFEIAAEVPTIPPGDGPEDMARAVGAAIEGIAPVVQRERPDWLLVLGDRGEQLGAVLAAIHFPVAVAHLAGGDRTLGAVDDSQRDMITRAAHLHFPGSEAAADRLRRLGEANWRIHMAGSPGLDDLDDLSSRPAAAVLRRYGLPVEGGHLLILQHPETRTSRDAAADMRETLGATAAIGRPRLAILPNTDAGGRAMAEQLRSAGIPAYASVPRPDFAVLLATAAALVGNSSAGIIEAPLLRVPAVNIGSRQEGRLQGDNVVDAAPKQRAIEHAIARAISPEFRASLSGTSPYGDGQAAPRLASVIAAQPIDDRLLRKADE